MILEDLQSCMKAMHKDNLGHIGHNGSQRSIIPSSMEIMIGGAYSSTFHNILRTIMIIKVITPESYPADHNFQFRTLPKVWAAAQVYHRFQLHEKD